MKRTFLHSVLRIFVKEQNLKWIPDALYLRLRYFVLMKNPLHLKNPKTFNEKLQWLKLYDRRLEYTDMVDKCEVKRIVADKVGEEYIIKTYGVWNSFDEIDFDTLPEQFVLKCTHDSGGLVIVTDKALFDKDKAREKIEKCMKLNFYWSAREWPYKNVKPRIIAEEYMEDAKTSELRDYKFFCFDGEPKALFVASERQKEDEETKFDFFDMDYNHLPIINGHPNAAIPPEKPVNFDKMKELAATLSEGIPHLRVDFYEVNGKVYFGELTFSHWSGMVPFEPAEWDKTFGDWIKLPTKGK